MKEGDTVITREYHSDEGIVPRRLHGYILKAMRNGERAFFQPTEGVGWNVGQGDVMSHRTVLTETMVLFELPQSRSMWSHPNWL